MHLDREQLERALAGELRSDRDLEQHLATCAECRARLDQARREETWLNQRLATLDHAAPRLSAVTVAARSRGFPSWQRVAAGIILALGAAGAAYAAPGSPLPGVIRRLAQLVAAPSPAPRESPSPSDSGVSQAGIAVAPGNRLRIEFGSARPGDTAIVSLSDASEVTVRASGGNTRFASEADRLIVRQAGAPGRFEIRIPRAAPSVELRVAERSVLLKQGSRLTADAHPDSVGRYVVPLAPVAP